MNCMAKTKTVHGNNQKMKLPLRTAQISPPPLVGSFRPTGNSLCLIIFKEHRSMKFDFFLLKMLEIILILTWYHEKKSSYSVV